MSNDSFVRTFPWMLLCLALCGLGLIAAGGDAPATPTTAVTNTRTNTEVLSRNQLNVLSDVQNCYGDGSCQTLIVTQTQQVVTSGDRNDVQAGMLPVCWDANLQTYTSSACGVQP